MTAMSSSRALVARSAASRTSIAEQRDDVAALVRPLSAGDLSNPA